MVQESADSWYKICPQCSFFCNTKEPDTFCSQCGSKLIDHCPSCRGKIANPYAKYCKYCGASLPGRNDNGKNEF